MPKQATGLTAIGVKTKKQAGLYADGKGLYLHVSRTGAKSWIFRYQLPGKARRDMGIGSAADVKLAEARALVEQHRVGIRRGIDPIENRKAERRAANPVTFRQCAESYIEEKTTLLRDAASWPAMFANHAYPIIGNMPVASVDREAVERVLGPIWRTKNKTASTLRGRIEAVLAFATVKEHRSGENPARWKGYLDQVFTSPKDFLGDNHHAALPYEEMPDFMARVRAKEGMTLRAIEFAILTAARSGEVRGARWSEIDFETGIWTIPAERMKNKKSHRQPLSTQAVRLLEQVKRITGGGNLVFPGLPDRPMRSATLREALHRLQPETEITLHGFRSTFRVWAAEKTRVPGEIAELALAHTVLKAVEAAYQRSDLIEKRRQLMNAWANFLDQRPAKVVPIHAGGRA